MRSVKGFTLIELMISIALLGVIVSLAAPAMGDFVIRQRVSGQASELMLAMSFARAEAAKRNANIVVLPATNSTTGWSDGWCVGPESMINCTHNDRLRSFSGASSVAITSDFLASNPKLTFKRDGTVISNRPFTVTSPRLKATGNDARCIDLSLQGRPSLRKVPRDTAC
ncbi:GspH/FimT family pseudopilin [Pseudomonas sp. MBLB4123]|uniref:GspH/FimT family pseudopilin n=1 Tax=Pseudomonas sp. MBLB4123 TaxID=3451557 RepID=UPI003F74FAD3